MTLIVNSEWKHLVMEAKAILDQPYLKELLPMAENWSTSDVTEHPLEEFFEPSCIYPTDSYDNWGDDPNFFLDDPNIQEWHAGDTQDWVPETEKEEESSSSEFALL